MKDATLNFLKEEHIDQEKHINQTEVQFHELFDIAEIQKTQDLFAKVNGVASIITDPSGHPITKLSNFCRFCKIVRQTEIGCSNCHRSDAMIGQYHPSGPIIQKCLSGGLWDAGVSITVGEKHIANWLIGQVRNSEQNEADMRAYARKIGADEAEFMEAFFDVPEMTLERFKEIADMLFLIVDKISSLKSQNLRQSALLLERKKNRARLELLSKAVEHAAEAVVVTDKDGNIEYANPIFEKITGYTLAEVKGKNPRILKSGKHDESFYKILWETISNGKVWQGTFINRKKDGTLFHEEGSIAPVKDSNGEISHFVAVKRDITEMLNIELRLNQAYKMEAIGTLAGGIAHDFNNILFPILGYAEMVKQMPDDGELVKMAIDQIYHSGMRAKELVNQILTFSRQDEQVVAPLNLKPLIKESVKFLRSSIPASVDVQLTIDPEYSMKINADATQMHQVIMNLVTNAFQAIPNKVGKIEISLDSFAVEESHSKYLKLPEGHYARLTVSDTGIGIPRENINRIFEPYYTTKAKGEGTGLGLAVVHGIVKKCQGNVFIYSDEGRGSRFTVYLPAVENCGDKRASGDKSETIPRGKGETILLVDDEKEVLQMEKMMLERLGYNVITLFDSIKALSIIEKDLHRFDLVITDMTMPQVTGIDIARKVKSIESTFPVIICTGLVDDVDIALSHEMSIGAILSKPIQLAELARTIRRVLDG